MQVKRKFERCGPLYLLDYRVDQALPKFNRYRNRFVPKLAFGHIQGNSVLGGTLTTKNLVLGAAPTLGNIVCVGFAASVAVTGLTVVDGNSNAYVVTPNSPSTFQSPAGQVWLAYLLSAPANASATITLTWVTAATPVIFADEFSVTGGTAAFDTDIPANSNIAGTAINTPSITPAAAGELLYAMAAAGGTISSPVAGGTQGLWTGSGGAIAFGDMAEYDLSGASGATAVDFVQSSGKWSAMAMAIKISASGGTPQVVDQAEPDFVWLGGDEY